MPRYVTKQRKALLEYLGAHADETLSGRQIAEDLSCAKEPVSLSAVYRNLAQLEAEGKVRRVSREGSREALYRYTDAETCKEHLHLSCSRCGKTYHMDVPATNALIRTVAEGAGFALDSTSTVLVGTCASCRRKGETL